MGASQFTVSGEITLDSSGVEAGTKQVKSHFQEMGASGIAAFEEMQRKYIEVAKQTSALRSQLLDNQKAQLALSSAVQAGNVSQDVAKAKTAALSAEQARLTQALQLSRREFQAVSQQSSAMLREQTLARENASALAATFGVRLPEGISHFITQSKAAQDVLAAAFNVTVIAAFGAALFEVGEKGYEEIKRLSGETEELAAWMKKAVAESDEALVSQPGTGKAHQAVQELAKRAQDADAVVSALREELRGFGQPTDLKGFERLIALSLSLESAEKAAVKTSDEARLALLNETKQRDEASTSIQSQTEKLVEARKELALAGIAQDSNAAARRLQVELAFLDQEKAAELSNVKLTGEQRVAIEETYYLKRQTLEAQWTQTVIAEGQKRLSAIQAEMLKAHQEIAKYIADETKYAPKLIPFDTGYLNDLKAGQSAVEEFNRITVSSTSASLTGLNRIIYDTQQQKIAIFEKASDTIAASESLSASEQANIWAAESQAEQAIEAEKATKIAELNKQAYDKMNQQVSSFIDRVFMQAKSLKDVLDQLWTQMLDSFIKRLVAPMITNWLTGMNQLGAGAVSGGRGILGGFMATLFGVPAAASTGYAAAGAGAGPVASSYNGIRVLPLSMPSGVAVPSGGASTGLLGNLALGSTGKIGFFSKGATGGWTTPVAGLLDMAALAGGLYLGSKALTANTPLSGALSGMASSALIGLELGGPFGAIIGAGIGETIGLIAGIFGRGAAKEKATSLFQQYQQQERDLYHKFEHHEVDYDSAVSGEEQIGSAGDYALTHAGIGKWGKRGAQNLDSQTAMYLAAIEKIEDERDTRGSLIGAMTVPEFSEGGLAALAFGRPDGHRLAWIDPYEYIIRPEATAALGTALLDRLNRAPNFASGGIVGPRISIPVASEAEPQGGRRGGVWTVNANFYINALDGPSMTSWWRANQAHVVRTLRRAVAEGM